ncbi:MAG TPA: site-specific integrase [Dehalococcoidia bacterium]|nr:site-specific integrase [Dehalococcoidia bacterium]
MSKRRGNGEGAIFKRGDGRWTATLTLEQGRRKSYYGKTRAEVADKLAAALTERQNGSLIPREQVTVSAYLERWLRDAAAPAVRATTMMGYERMIRLHINPNIGKTRLARLTPEALSRLYRELLDQGMAPKYVRLIHALLHRALKQAVRWRMVNVNVADAVDAPSAPRREFHALNAAEARRFLEVSLTDSNHALYVLALTCGMRQGEILGLRWADVDLDGGWLSVSQQVQRIGKKWVFSEPKTSRGRRRLALPTIAVHALREQRIRVASQRLKAPAWEDHDLVFPNLIGRPIEKQNLMRRSFKPLLERAGLPNIRFHDLRHSAATIMLAMGEHPRVVQERLGHSTIAVTMDVYSHVMPGLQEESAARLDKVFAAS